MNRWNEIVLSLNDCKKRGILEEEYHAEIENLFRILGWSRHNGSIQHKKSIPIGSQKEIEADIVLEKDTQKIAIEVKHPNNKLKKRQIEQLASYMRQIKTSVGLYIGEKICLFYDIPDEDNMECCLELQLAQEQEEGLVLCSMFDYRTFSYENILKYCVEKYKLLVDRKTLSKKITSWQEDSNDTEIKQILSDYFLSKGYSLEIVTEELQKLRLFVKDKGIDKRIPLPGETTGHKTSKGFRRYRVNKGQLAFKRDIVLSVISQYLREHPQTSFFSLEETFKEVKCGRKLFLTVEELRRKSIESKDILGRYNCSEPDILTSGDGIDFVVCNQWAESNFPTFVKVVEDKIGWTITPETNFDHK